MKRFWFVFALLLGPWGASVQTQSSNADAFGDWRGTIWAGEVTLRAALHLGETSKRPITLRRVRPLWSRYWITKLLVPARPTPSPKPLSSLSQI